MKLSLSSEWTIGERIGSGGFGDVWAATSGDLVAAAKFIPKAPGADRELLFVDLDGATNVVPIIDHGEHEQYWVIVMPRADQSLRDYLDSTDAPLSIPDALVVLKDVCRALSDLSGRVVHRDLKPENVLCLEGAWCLADFGISRYAEATTAPDTQKFALSPPYAAPERWRSETATSAADVYALGVIAYEMLMGRAPFDGPSLEDFRDQHLHQAPPDLADTPPGLEALVTECLYKAPEARPPAPNVLARLESIDVPSDSPGLSRLQEANRNEARRRGTAARKSSQEHSEAERRQALAEAATTSFERISSSLLAAITSAAPTATLASDSGGAWSLRLGNAELRMSAPARFTTESNWGSFGSPAFDVIAASSLNLHVPSDRHGYEGRAHSLWFGDVQVADQYSWFETAFMFSPLLRRSSQQAPFELNPGEGAAKAIWTGMAEYQVAWPFTALIVGELQSFIDRWADWFATASEGRLSHPSQMPELQAEGSWRR